jgi:hypothetical protein
MRFFNRLKCSVSGQGTSLHAVMTSVLLVVVLALLSDVVVADTVHMKDGRSFQGVIVSQDESAVVLDTMVSGIRASGLTLTMDQIERIEKGEVPDGFFSVEPAPPPRSANAVDTQDRSGLYLVVPINGELGTDVVAGGITRVIAYAKRYRVPHLVFVVDSPGGSLDEILMINRVMRREHPTLTFHAVIRRSQGAALAIPLMCETLHVEPGAVIGDTEQAMGEGSKKFGNEDEQVLRTELARRAYEYAVSQGSPGVIVRAMIDPSEELVAWKDPDDGYNTARSLPEGVSTENVIFTTKAGEMLVLDYDQIVALGIPSLEGGVAGLGAALDIDNWQAESNYGEEAMGKLSDLRRKEQASGDARFKEKLKGNLLKRETTQASIENNIKQAKFWDPTNGDYATYTKRYGWGGRSRGRYRARDRESTTGTTLTKDSRNEWRRRSDLTLGYIRKAGKAAMSMKRLDAEAVKLGLEPTYSEGELDAMIEDMDVKYRFVEDQRNRRRQ